MSKQSDTQIDVTVLPSTKVDAPAGVPAVLVPNTIYTETSDKNSGKTINTTVGTSVYVNPS